MTHDTVGATAYLAQSIPCDRCTVGGGCVGCRRGCRFPQKVTVLTKTRDWLPTDVVLSNDSRDDCTRARRLKMTGRCTAACRFRALLLLLHGEYLKSQLLYCIFHLPTPRSGQSNPLISSRLLENAHHPVHGHLYSWDQVAFAAKG